MPMTVEANRSYIFIRLGRFEFFAQREAVPSRFTVSRPVPGEVIVDLSGVALMFTYRRKANAGG